METLRTGEGYPQGVQTLKTGKGYLRGASNDIQQEGKICTLYDGEIVLCMLPLDGTFPAPGILINYLFFTSLRIETDGQVEVYWDKEL
jgi:hypothetical protein